MLEAALVGSHVHREDVADEQSFIHPVFLAAHERHIIVGIDCSFASSWGQRQQKEPQDVVQRSEPLELPEDNFCNIDRREDCAILGVHDLKASMRYCEDRHQQE